MTAALPPEVTVAATPAIRRMAEAKNAGRASIWIARSNSGATGAVAPSSRPSSSVSASAYQFATGAVYAAIRHQSLAPRKSEVRSVQLRSNVILLKVMALAAFVSAVALAVVIVSAFFAFIPSHAAVARNVGALSMFVGGVSAYIAIATAQRRAA